MLISRSTIATNTVVGQGSTINIYSATANVTIEHSTISQNGMFNTTVTNGGGAISNMGTLTLANTVVAGNTENNPNHTNSDFGSSIGTVESKGFNFIGSNEGVEGVFPVVPQTVGDRAGTAAEPLDAMLNYLADNGGPTHTMMPKKYSPLINSGTCSGETQDQRGYRNLQTGKRPVVASPPAAIEDGCDTGAVEYLAQQPDPQFEDSFE